MSCTIVPMAGPRTNIRTELPESPTKCMNYDDKFKWMGINGKARDRRAVAIASRNHFEIRMRCVDTKPPQPNWRLRAQSTSKQIWRFGRFVWFRYLQSVIGIGILMAAHEKIARNYKYSKMGLVMKSFAKLLMVVPAFLLMMNAASAAFTFQISPVSSNVVIGGSQILGIFATESVGPNAIFTLTNQSISVAPGSDPDITFTLNMPALNTLLVATPGGNQIGTITASVAGTASNFDTASVTFRGVVSNFSGTTSGTYTSNSASITAVPEPSTFALVGLCAVGAIAVRRHRLRRQA